MVMKKLMGKVMVVVVEVGTLEGAGQRETRWPGQSEQLGRVQLMLQGSQGGSPLL